MRSALKMSLSLRHSVSDIQGEGEKERKPEMDETVEIASPQHKELICTIS